MALAAQNDSVQYEYSIDELQHLNSELEPTAQSSAKISAASPTNRLTFPHEQAQPNEQAQNDQAATHKHRSRLQTPARQPRRHHDEDADLPRSFREWEHTQREESNVSRRAGLRSHRTFRMTWTTTVVGAILFAQLLGALYLKALATSASHRAKDLEKTIVVEEAAIDKTQRKVSLASSDPRMGNWAVAAGYRPATQSDLDDVMNPKPLPQPNIEYSKNDAAKTSEVATR